MRRWWARKIYRSPIVMQIPIKIARSDHDPRCFSLADLDRAIAEQILGMSYDNYQRITDYMMMDRDIPAIPEAEIAHDDLIRLFGCTQEYLNDHPEIVHQYVILRNQPRNDAYRNALRSLLEHCSTSEFFKEYVQEHTTL